VSRIRNNPGFTLIEVLVALVLLMVALLAGGAMALQRPRALQRIEAQARAVRALEGTLEAVRAGALPLASGPAPGPPGIAMAVEARAAAIAGLWEVRIQAEYRFRGQLVRKELRSLVWRPL
jgi:Tfp pilus assembly protein PilV